MAFVVTSVVQLPMGISSVRFQESPVSLALICWQRTRKALADD